MGSVISMQGGMPLILSGASDGALVARPNRVAGASLEVPKELQRWYDGVTPVTLPCGRIVTPTKKNQRRRRFDKARYKGRNVVERLIAWLKERRRLATRFEKLAVNFLAMLKVGMLLWFLKKEL